MLFENPLLLQLIKYAISGVIATLAHIAVFHMVAWKMFPALQAGDHLVRLLKLPTQAIDDNLRARNSMIANVTAFLFSTLTAYILNIQWVFEAGRHHMLVELALFYAVAAISLVVGTGLMGALIKYFGVLTSYAFVCNIVSAASINFVVRKYLIFFG